eukprot:403340266
MNSKFKISLCKLFEQTGSCNFGNKCSYAHGAHELRRIDDPLPKQAIHEKIDRVPYSNYKTMKCNYFYRDCYPPVPPHLFHIYFKGLVIPSFIPAQPFPNQMIYNPQVFQQQQTVSTMASSLTQPSQPSYINTATNQDYFMLDQQMQSKSQQDLLDEEYIRYQIQQDEALRQIQMNQQFNQDDQIIMQLNRENQFQQNFSKQSDQYQKMNQEMEDDFCDYQIEEQKIMEPTKASFKQDDQKEASFQDLNKSEIMGLNASENQVLANQIYLDQVGFDPSAQTNVNNSVAQSQNFPKIPQVDQNTIQNTIQIAKSIRFNWLNANNNSLKLITAQFYFQYDQKLNIFKIKNDANRYTISHLSWQYLDDYGVFGFTLIDESYYDLKTKQVTKILNPISYTFDVSPDGQYQGMPEKEAALRQTIPLLGGKIEQTSETDQNSVMKLLDNQLKTLWYGLVENQMMIGLDQHQTLEQANSSNLQIQRQMFQNTLDSYDVKKLSLQDPARVINHIETKQLTENSTQTLYTNQIPNLKSIDNDLRRAQTVQKQEQNSLQFSRADISYTYLSKIRADNYRPIQSEQTTMKNIVFVQNSKNLAIEIIYDSKLVFCIWDDIQHMLPTNFIEVEIKSFRKRSFEKLDKIKLELINQKIVPMPLQ